MKNRIWVSLLGLLVFAQSANASLYPAIKITSDYFQNRSYEIGFDINESSLIEQVYFQDEKGEKTFYSLADLSRFVTIFKVMGVNLVKMKIIKMESPVSGTIELQVLRNYFTGSRVSFYFKVFLDQASKQYQIVDSRSGQEVNRALVVTRYFGPTPVGIDTIETE